MFVTLSVDVSCEARQAPLTREAKESLTNRDAEKAPAKPLGQRVEDELAAAEGVLAHAGDLVVDAQAEPLLEVRPCVCDVAPCVSPDLVSREHCSVLGLSSLSVPQLL